MSGPGVQDTGNRVYLRDRDGVRWRGEDVGDGSIPPYARAAPRTRGCREPTGSPQAPDG